MRAVSSRTAMDLVCSAAGGEPQDPVQTTLTRCFYFFLLLMYRIRGLAALEMQSPEVNVVFMIIVGTEICNKLHSWQFEESPWFYSAASGGQISPSPIQ